MDTAVLVSRPLLYNEQDRHMDAVVTTVHKQRALDRTEAEYAHAFNPCFGFGHSS